MAVVNIVTVGEEKGGLPSVALQGFPPDPRGFFLCWSWQRICGTVKFRVKDQSHWEMFRD